MLHIGYEVFWGERMEKKVESIPSESPLYVEPSLKGILECFYGLNELQVNLFHHILTQGRQKVKDLSEKFGRDESVVYRALKSLCELGLLEKESVKNGIGRPYHQYHAVKKNKLREKLLTIAEEWFKRIKKILERI